MTEITFKGVWESNDPPEWETFSVLLFGEEAGDYVDASDVVRVLAANGLRLVLEPIASPAASNRKGDAE